MTLTLEEILAAQQRAFVDDGPVPATLRQDRISRLQALVMDHLDEFVEALAADFGVRPRTLSLQTDLLSTVTSLDHDRNHLEKWMQPQKFSRWRNNGVDGEVRPTPKGVVGVIGPWNFPLNLVLLPAGSAFAAGNRVMVRPSEVTAQTTATLARLAGDYFDVTEFAVATEEHGDGAAFAALRFDHLFFTGSPAVGALVAAAAGANLVPTTLELGGKNPIVVDRSADLGRTARRIADSRLVNGGQVCLCPDYAYVPAESLDDFVAGVLARWRTKNPGAVGNSDYTSIVNDRNYQRVTGLIDDARDLGATAHIAVADGAPQRDAASRQIAPVLLTDVTPQMRIAGEEVFGPVLTVYPYDDIAAPIAHINSAEHPLTLYWYGERNERFEQVLGATRSGSVNIGDFGANLAHAELPFGGVGQSGSGAYHGRYGFDTFSHQRAIAAAELPISISAMLTGPFPRMQRAMDAMQLRGMRRKFGR